MEVNHWLMIAYERLDWNDGSNTDYFEVNQLTGSFVD